jgi:hypothetical protein
MLEEHNMTWSHEYNSKLQIVELVYAGETTARDLQVSTSELIALEKEKGINRFIVDATDMEVNFSLMDVYNLPTKQYIEENADRKGRVAVVLQTSPRTKEAVDFYEDVCRNRGWMVQVFSKREEAIDWLADS